MAKSILLYRFLSADAGLKTIERAAFRVGRVLEFNDPFEWRMGVCNIVPEGEIVADAVFESIVKARNLLHGIICFSETMSEPVLWSHYADKHRGVAFEVDHLIGETLHKMRYTDERPVLDANRLNDPGGLEKYLKPLVEKMIFQKSTGWAYEREYRVFVDLEKCEVGSGHYFTPIPKDFLKRVILGHQCSLEENYVRKLLKRAGLDGAEVLRAKMATESYLIRAG